MSSSQWCFDRFRLDPTHACLWRDAEPIPLPPKAFDVVHYLVTHPDRLVTKDELLDAVWPATAVSDAVVRVAIGALRKALGDTARTPRFLATVPRRGYRFVAPVEAYTEGAAWPSRARATCSPPAVAHVFPNFTAAGRAGRGCPSGCGRSPNHPAAAGGRTPPPHHLIL